MWKIFAAFLALILAASLRPRRKRQLPPGPKGVFLLGNLFDVPSDESVPWKVYADWGKKYGDIIYFRVLQKSVVVINSAKIAHELLEKRSAIYSCRPHVPMAGDVIGWNWALPLVPYGETFRRHRKYLQQYFANNRLPDYYRIQRKEAHRMINDILDDPDNYKSHIERMAGAIIMEIVFGHEVKSIDDRFLQIASRGGRTIAAAGAVGAHIVDLIPPLRFLPDWLPGTGFKRLPPGTREALAAMREVPFNNVKEEMAAGTARPCYIADLLEDTKHQDEAGVRDTGANVYSAGFDTTLSSLMTAVIALVIDPVIQARAQAELDTVVGKNRFPDFDDRQRLPYIQCIISEAFRWGATTPVGVPHRVTQDDVYDGYFIPGGTTVIANAWAMLHNPEVYPEPETFNPDRFLAGEGRTPQPDPRACGAFGFGRRECPGQDIAENTIWIAIVSLFYAFKITPAVDEDGKEIPIDCTHSEHSVRHPKPFKCTIKPRRDNSITLIRQSQE
ncbi:cytochrome P450 [Flammula alnicola]|nr:cytochrome P450 [Flammula alnicola]